MSMLTRILYSYARRVYQLRTFTYPRIIQGIAIRSSTSIMVKGHPLHRPRAGCHQNSSRRRARLVFANHMWTYWAIVPNKPMRLSASLVLSGRHHHPCSLILWRSCEKGTIDRLCTNGLEQRSGQLLLYEHVLCDDMDFAILAKNLVPFLASDCLTTGPTIGSTSWTSRLHANLLRETQ